MVEGGQNIFTQFIFSGMTDELHIFVAPRILGAGLAAVAERDDLKEARFELKKCRMAGKDMLLSFRSKV